MNASDFRYVDDPTVDVRADGTIGVGWVDQSRKDIFFRRYAPDGSEYFDKPVNVSRSSDIFSWFPKVVLPSEEPKHVYILWQEIVFSGGTHGGEIFFARSTDGGTTFEDTINLSNSMAGDGKGRLTPERWHNGSLDLIAGQEGTLYAAWTEYEGTLWFSRSTDGGEHFSEPLRIAGGMNANPARGPSLAASGDTLYVAWTVGDDPNADIHVRKSSDGGRSFGKPRIVSDSDGHSDAPKVAVDSRGTLHLVYGESPSGPMQRYHIRYTQLQEGEDAFDRPRDISKSHATEFASVNFPSLRVDGADNLYVLWELFPRYRWPPQGLGITYSGDGGQTFAHPSMVPGSAEPALGVNGSQQGLLMEKLAVNTSGTIAVANSTYKRNQESHIWLFRGQATGP